MIDPRRICQIEIQVSDVERALGFYEHVFGWRRMPAELHEYIVLEVPEECSFGISLVPSPGLQRGSGHLVVYFSVDDPDAIAAKAEQFGGARRFGPQKLGGYGEIYQITDPDGQRFGLYRKTLSAK